MIQVLKGAADAHKDNNIKNFKNTAPQKTRGGFSFYGNDGREEKEQTAKIYQDKRIGKIIKF